VYRYCYRSLGSQEAAEDATSQIFTQALAALHRYKSGSFRAWLFTIAHNVVVDEARRRRPASSLDLAETLVDPAPELDQAFIEMETRQTNVALRNPVGRGRPLGVATWGRGGHGQPGDSQ